MSVCVCVCVCQCGPCLRCTLIQLALCCMSVLRCVHLRVSAGSTHCVCVCVCVCVYTQANKRIDGLYIYCAPPSMEELARRMRGRLREAESTIEKRITWANEQTQLVRARHGCYLHSLFATNQSARHESMRQPCSEASMRGLVGICVHISVSVCNVHMCRLRSRVCLTISYPTLSLETCTTA